MPKAKTNAFSIVTVLHTEFLTVLLGAMRSRLEPIRRVARMIKRHWEGVINAATSPVTHARAEAINSRIQWLKNMACGYRNRARFREAIYFQLGGLDLSPAVACRHMKP